MNQPEPPVNVGETYEVSINAVGGKGDGIAKVKGFVVFVPGVQQGDYVKIRITKVLPKVGFAELVEKLERPANLPHTYESKYANFKKEELQQPTEPEQQFEETDNFGE